MRLTRYPKRAIFAITILAGCLAFWFYAVRVLNQGASPYTYCMSNMKQIGAAVQIYAAQNDDTLMAKAWYNELIPIAKNKAMLSCSLVLAQGDEGGYALEVETRGRKVSSFAEPNKAVVFFEIGLEKRDVVANFLCIYGRHQGGFCVVNYVDGHAKGRRIHNPLP